MGNGELDSAIDESGAPAIRRAGLVLGPILFVALLLAPGLALEPAARRAAAVTALTATWWISGALPIGATSLLPAALFPLLGVMSASKVCPLYMEDIVFLFLAAMLLSRGLERWNVHRRVALSIIARVGTSPRRLVLGFMISTAFVSLWTNNTATTLLMIPIGLAVVESVEGGPSRTATPFAMSLLLGIAYSASVGGMGTPVGTAPNQVFVRIFSTLYPRGPEVSFGSWMLAWMPVVILYLALGWLLLSRLALRVPERGARGEEIIHAERAALGPIGRGEAMMATLFGVTACLWLTRAELDLGFLHFPGWARSVLPDSIAEPDRYITDATVATAAALLGFVLPVDRRAGVTLLDWRSTARIPWDVLLLIGAGFALAGGFRESGLDQALGRALGPLIEGRPAWQIVPVIVALVVFASEITSNTAIAVVLLPVLGSAAVAAGISPLLTMMPAAIAASGGFMLPVATPPNAIVFATGRVPPTTMARVGFWMNLLVIAIIVVVFFAFGTRVLRIEPGVAEWALPAK